MATVISTQPRHVLTPLSPRKRTVLGNVTNIVRGLDTTLDSNGKGQSFSKSSLLKKPLGLSPGKRPFYTIYDENAPVNATTQTKRMKSQLSAASCDENSIPKYALVTKTLSSLSSSLVVSKKKTVNASSSTTSLKRRTHNPSTAPAPSTSSSGRPALSRKDSLATLSSPSKGIKRKIQKTVRRVDPPTHLSKSGKDVESIDGRLIATPVAKSGNATGNTWRPGQNFPETWMFEIHEDTLEETLTNLMYHGAGTLDISDEEDLKSKCSEVDRVGKENIPPPRSEDQLAMPPPPAPRRDEVEDMDEERIRSPLGEADVEIFYPNLKKEREEAEKLKKMKQEEKRNCLMSSKFAVIGNIVEDYLKQQKDTVDVLAAAAVPLPADDDDEENLEDDLSVTDENAKTKDVKVTTKVPTISVENYDFDSAIDTQTRALAEDELFGDDL